MAGYKTALSEQQWRDFGAALRHLHTVAIPPTFRQHLRRETFADRGRQTVKNFLAQLDKPQLDDPIARQLTVFLKAKQAKILDLVERAEQFAETLQANSPTFVICHSDIHAGKLLINSDDGHFYLVDWDEPILAPKERDLMFIGGGQGFIGYTPQEEESLFYQGYGQIEIDPLALAYYRYERIIQDIAIFCEELLLTTKGGQDRQQSLRYLISNFLPGGTIERAYMVDDSPRRPREE